jgi:hypothetical protein
MQADPTARPLIILTPVFNDWTAFDRLVADLDDALAAAHLCARVLAVDDGSTEEPRRD